MSDRTIDGSLSYLQDAASAGCAESRLLLSRRGMLGLTAGLFSSAMLPRSAFASSCGARDPRMLLVILRGGMDGLAALAPIGDPEYRAKRNMLAYGEQSKLLGIAAPNFDSNYWALHPAFRTIAAEYRAGNVAFVHGVAPPYQNRSHFDCQENLENGHSTIRASRDGWLNRFLADKSNCVAAINSDGKAAIQIGRTPLVMHGAAKTMGWTPTSYPSPPDATLQLIRSMYKGLGETQLLGTLDLGLEGLRKAGGPSNGADKGSNPEGRDDVCTRDDETELKESLLVSSFRGAGNLLGDDEGPRIATLNFDGWDTHTDEFSKNCQLATSIGIGALFSQLDMGVSAFKKAVGSKWSQTVVVVVTEFGRMVINNGNLGSDHGTGSVAMLIGGAVNGGRVLGNWDGLRLRENRDLAAVNDLRSVFKGVLVDHFGMVDTASSALNGRIFPGSKGAADTLPGLIRA
jgi:uncharacterized protein (DUF1501 family)